MLLFKSDWARYPTAIVDYDTTNESFKRLVYLYKEMGIDNCEFPLALYQPELVGVDPYAEDLSEELKFKISIEARYNPWYFFREIARIPPNSGTEPIRFKATRGNIALYWSFFNHIDFGLVQPRQTGKSVSTDVLNIGVLDVWADNTTINLITKDAPLRTANVERLKEMRDLLPDYIYYPNRLDADNNELITNVAKGNRYKTAVGRNDRLAADKLGRGLTVPILHFDELAYIAFIGISLPVALSSGSAARDEAAAAGQLYGNIYTTTAGNINSRDGRYAYQFMTGGAPWSEHFLDLPDQPTLAKVVEKNSPGQKPLIYGAFNHRQLGRTDEWLYRKLRESNSSGELADRDYMNIWTTGTESSPLSAEEKKIIKDSGMEPLHVEFFDSGFMLRWFIPEHEIAHRMESSKFVMGMDPSDTLGAENDATTIVIIDAYTHDVVATARINEGNLSLIGVFMADILIKYPNITMIPERKSSGKALLDTIFIQLQRKNIDPFRRIYNRIVDEPENFEFEYQEITKKPPASRPPYFYDRYMKYFGFVTAGSGRHARDALYVTALKSMVKIGGRRIHDKTLVDELLSLMTRDGRIDHGTGNHDDMVISILLAHWLCIQGKNLKFYGIDPSKVFSNAKTDDEEDTPERQFHKELRQQNMDEFNRLMEDLKSAKDPMVISKLEMQLRRLSMMFNFDESAGVGIDALIKQVQDERSRRTKVGRFQSDGRPTNPYHLLNRWTA